LFYFSIIYLFPCARHIVLSLYLILLSRIVLVALDIRATNYFASLFIDICRFNNTFLASNKEIDANKIVIYLQKIILLAIKEDVLAFKSCFSFLLCLIFYNLLITNKRIESFNKIENLKIFNNISSAFSIFRTYINYLEFALYIRINCLIRRLQLL